MRLMTLCGGLLLLVACGQPEPQTSPASPGTPFGTAAEVSGYLQQISPYVQEIGRLQVTVEQALSSATPGAEPRRGTGRNLAEAAKQVRPRLQEILKEFDGLEPPALLAPFHRDTKKLMLLRLEAYRLVAEGWQTEEAGADFQTLYDSAEARLREANEMISSLNAQMGQINQALEAAAAASGEAATQ